MKVIFLEDFKSIKTCEVIDFFYGYCVNFLIPNFIVIYLDKKINKFIFFFKELLKFNDLKKKEFLKKIYIKYNNKNIYIKKINYNFNLNIFYKKYFLKKIGFIYYNYYIFFKKIKDDSYIFDIKVYNNIYIKFFVFIA